MKTEQKQELEKLRSKWNLECATAQKNKVAYVLRRSKDNYLRVIGSENGLLQYQAEVLELTTGIGNQKEVAIVERERIVDLVDEVFEHVPEDTVLGSLRGQLQQEVRGVFNRKSSFKREARYTPSSYPDPAGIDALELSGPKRGCSILRSKAASALVFATVFLGTSMITSGASATPVTYQEKIVGQKLKVPETAAPPRAARTFGIYVPQLIYPFDPSTIGDGWGWRAKSCGACSEFHQGIDFLPGYGSEIPAVMSGTVTVAEYSGSLGVHVYVDDGYGMVTMYGHMIDGSIRVNVGDKVTRGQILGQVGNTGVSTGPHLHLAIEWDGVVVNPLTILDTFPVRPGLGY